MLTLTRKAGQSIRIGDDIRIVVREIKGRQVRIGIEAPGDVPVFREEIYLKMRGRPEEGEDGGADRVGEGRGRDTGSDQGV